MQLQLQNDVIPHYSVAMDAPWRCFAEAYALLTKNRLDMWIHGGRLQTSRKLLLKSTLMEWSFLHGKFKSADAYNKTKILKKKVKQKE